MRRIWNNYFEDLYNITTREQAASLHGFYSVQKGNYFGGEPIRRTEVEARVRNLKNRKAEGKNEVIGEMIKVEGDTVVDRI